MHPPDALACVWNDIHNTLSPMIVDGPFGIRERAVLNKMRDHRESKWGNHSAVLAIVNSATREEEENEAYIMPNKD